MYMKNSFDTEDMVQQTFIHLLTDHTTFQSIEHEKAWLIRTAKNVCKDFLKSWWNRTVHLKNNITHRGTESIKIDETLQKVLKLPSPYRTVLYLYYYEGYTTVEIAEMLQKNVSTVRGHLHRARHRLKITIEKEVE